MNAFLFSAQTRRSLRLGVIFSELLFRHVGRGPRVADK
jgi:hypothetical protein